VDSEEFLERAAIIEFCGNVSRKEAERLARMQLRSGNGVPRSSLQANS